jgi:hypothetical protein
LHERHTASLSLRFRSLHGAPAVTAPAVAAAGGGVNVVNAGFGSGAGNGRRARRPYRVDRHVSSRGMTLASLRRVTGLVLPATLVCGLALGGRALGAQQTSPAQPAAPPPSQPAAAPAHRPASAQAAAQAPAQAAPPDTVHHFSGVVGVAIDSLHGSPGPLVGAVVVVNGTSRHATTDDQGKFRIDSVPPGTYTLGLAHPGLDSIGLAVGSQGIPMPAGRYVVVRLATPSPRTAVGLLCPHEKMELGPSAVIGRVLDADTEGPDSGIRVVVYWTALEVSASLGVRRATKVREAHTDAGGLYRVCGVPSNMEGQLRASRNGVTTADVPLSPQGDFMMVNVLYLGTPDTAVVATAAGATGGAPGARAPGAAAAAGAPKGAAPPPAGKSGVPVAAGLRTGQAMVSGRVVDQKGNALSGASISVEGAAPTTVTTDSGHYTLRGLPNGTQALEVRKLGFAPARVTVDLSNHTPRTQDVKLSAAPPQLATVVVEGKMDKGLRDVGFTGRKQAGIGHFVTADQIAERGAIRLTDIFSQMPGIRVNYTVDPPQLVGSRDAQGGCITYVFDGVQTPMDDPGDFDTFMQPDEIAAVEVYTSSEAPPQYSTPGKSSCTVIMIWTKTRVGGFN